MSDSFLIDSCVFFILGKNLVEIKPITKPKTTISRPINQDIEKERIKIATTTKALQISLISLASSSITLSGSLYNLFINSPTPISSKALAGRQSIFLYKSTLTFSNLCFCVLISLYILSLGICSKQNNTMYIPSQQAKYFKKLKKSFTIKNSKAFPQK